MGCCVLVRWVSLLFLPISDWGSSYLQAPCPALLLNMSCHMLRRVRRAAYALLAAVLLSLSSTAHAQWSIRANVGASHFVKMLDEVGQPHVGFIGLNTGGMLRTEDTGYTWQRVTFTPGSNDEIYDVAFKNGLTGFAVGAAYAYKTIDGGYTWTVMADIRGRAVHYAKRTDLLLISCWADPAQASTNDGASWYTFSSSQMNGFTYIDDLRILFTTHAGLAKFSTDGGLSWETSNMSTEVYQPTALKNRGWYIGVSETEHTVRRTTDGGFNWDLIEYVNNPTGCVRGSDANLIAQTRSGMMRSTNQGDDWTDICGPSNIYDTRFWVRGLEIFAVSGSGLLYYNPTSTAGNTDFRINISPNPLRLTTDGCNIPTGAIRVSTDACATRLTDAWIIGSGEFTFGPGHSLPAPMNSSAEVPIVYTPVGTNDDSATIMLRIDVGGLIVDTFVKVYGTTAPVLTPSVTPDKIELSMSAIDCKIDQESISIVNSGCDPFTIDSIRMLDPLHFSVSGPPLPATVVGQGSLVYNIFSNTANVKKAEGALFIYVSNGAGKAVLKVELILRRVGPVLRPMDDKRYSFNTSCAPIKGSVDFTNLTCDTIIVDSVQLSNTALYKLLPLSVPRVLDRDQSITIPFEVLAPRPGPSASRVVVYMHTLGQPTQQVSYLFASTTVKVVLPADTVKFVAAGTCPDFDSTFSITNILCDSIRILELKPLFQPQFTITLPQTPLALGPNEATAIGVSTATFFKGTTRTSIMMRYEAYGKIYDTIVHVAVRSQNSFTIDPKLQKLNFGRTSVCAPQTRTVYIDNRYCIPVTIDQVALSSATSDRFSILSQPVAQRVLAPGERDSVVLQFAPDAIGARTGAVTVRLKSAIISLDTFFTIEGIGTGAVNANIRDTQLDLGAALTCQHLERTTVVRNDGCVALTITSVSPNGGTFSLASPSLPYSIPAGDSVTLTFEVSTMQPGSYNLNVTVRLLSDQKIEQLLDCKLSATLTEEAPRFVVQPLVLGQLDGCKSFDTTIMVRNPLLCDPIEMTAEFTSPDASIIGPNSAIIPPGRFFIFQLRFDPNTATSVGLRLRSSLIDTTLPITYSFSVGSGGLVITGPEDTLQTNACDVILDTVRMQHFGCGYGTVVAVDMIPVGGTSTKFSIDGALALPIELYSPNEAAIPIRFDPNAIGSNSAILRILDVEGMTREFKLNADFLPVGSMGASITSAGAKQVVVGESFDVDLEVSASLPQPVTVDDLLAELEYDSDLLTLVSVKPQGNWQVRSQDAGAGGASLSFAHPSTNFGANAPLAKLTFRTALAREIAGSIKLKSVQINAADPRFSKCVASTIFHESSNDASITYYCGGETLRNALNGILPFHNIMVQPHPASAADRALHVSFDSEIDASMSLELVNVLGVTTSIAKIDARTGHNEIQLPLNNTNAGWHLLRLKTEHGNAGIRVLVTE